MTKMRPRLTFTIALLALVLIFALQNTDTVEVEFFFWGLALPRSLLIFTVLMVGMIAGWFLRGAVRRNRA